MDISALVNHDGDAAVLPRRSLSNPHSLSAPSPVVTSATLPPASKPTRRQMPLQRLQDQREQARPPPPVAQPQPTPQPHAQPPPPPALAHRNGAPTNGNGAHPHAVTSTELTGFERPVSNDAQIYDDVSRKVCDFIWNIAVNSDPVRNAIAESEHTQLEIEARWGQIIDRTSGKRLRGFHDTEAVIRSQGLDIQFESTMTMEQHKRMNMYLNTRQLSSHTGSGYVLRA
jgi:polynucleotide 5'-triphosphatase